MGILDDIIEEATDEDWQAAEARLCVEWPPIELGVAEHVGIRPLIALAAMPPASREIH